MKLQEASKKEVKRIAKGTAICTVIMLIGLLILSFVGVGSFSYKTVLGAVGGACIAFINFTMMCLMIKKAAAMTDEKMRKVRVQASYNLRLMMMAAWLIIAFFVPFISVVAAAIPLLFPNVVIYYLNATGKLLPPDVHSESKDQQIVEEPEDDKLGPFEN